MENNAYNLPLGSRVLVTGANGFIASHIVDKLLRMGYMVRGTIREAKPWLHEMFEQKYGMGVFETVTISSFDNQDHIERILKDVDAVVHAVSSPVSDRSAISNIGYRRLI